MDSQFGGRGQITAGLYFGGDRHESLPTNVTGIDFVDDASANHGETSQDFGMIFQHANMSPDAERTTWLSAKLWSCGWHLQYVSGVPMFILGGFPTTSSGAPLGTTVPEGFPSTTCSAIDAVTLVTIFQLNAFLEQVNKNLQIIIRGEIATMVGMAGIMGRMEFDVHLARDPINYVLTKLPEEAWANRYASPDYMERAAGAMRLRTLGIDANGLHAVIEAAYKKFPNLGWCNGLYISRNLRFVGIAMASSVSHRTQSVSVSTVVQFTARCFDYWPAAKSGHHIGFVIAPLRSLGSNIPDPGNQAFAVIPWSSSKWGSSKCGLAFTRDESFDERITSTTYNDPSGSTHPFILFDIGRVIRTDTAIAKVSVYPYIENLPSTQQTAWELCGISYDRLTKIDLERAFQLTKALTQTTTISVTPYV